MDFAEIMYNKYCYTSLFISYGILDHLIPSPSLLNGEKLTEEKVKTLNCKTRQVTTHQKQLLQSTGVQVIMTPVHIYGQDDFFKQFIVLFILCMFAYVKALVVDYQQTVDFYTYNTSSYLE